MRKLFASLCITAILAVVCGCGEKPPATPATPPAQPAAPPADPPK